MRFCCGVTLFNPDNDVIKILKKYLEIFDTVYIFDNSENIPVDFISTNRLHTFNNFKYTSYNENFGLSKAFNEMSKKAIDDRYDYICLFDQDSFMEKSHLVRMMSYIQNSTNTNIAIYSPKIIYRKKKNYVKEIELEFKSVTWVISSGSFINLDIYSISKGFDNNYFIDRIDYDYCYQVKKLGFQIFRLNNIFLQQQLGKTRKGIFAISEHDYLRHYYIFRNRLYFYLIKKEPSILNKTYVIIKSISHITRIILLESGKFKKLYIIKKAIIDYNNKQMGRIIYEKK